MILLPTICQSLPCLIQPLLHTHTHTDKYERASIHTCIIRHPHSVLMRKLYFSSLLPIACLFILSPHSLFLLWTSFYWQELAGLKQTEKDLHWGRSVFVCTASLKHRLILSLKSSPEEPEKFNEFSPAFYCTVIQHLQGTGRSKGKYFEKVKKKIQIWKSYGTTA